VVCVVCVCARDLFVLYACVGGCPVTLCLYVLCECFCVCARACVVSVVCVLCVCVCASPVTLCRVLCVLCVV